MTSSYASSRLLIGRLGAGRVTIIGAGVAVAPRIVMVPLSMSGPLRPRDGVVVLPDADAHPFEAHPVVRISRSEPSTGDVLGLQLAAPVGNYQDPPPILTQQWLQERLQGRPMPTGLSGAHPGAENPPDVAVFLPRPDGARSGSNGRSRSRVCVIFPRLCK